MRIVVLDGSGWTMPYDVLQALHGVVDLPAVREWNIDVLVDALVHMSPTTIRVTGNLDAGVRTKIEALANALRDARLWRSNHRYDAVEVVIEIVP